MKRHPDWFAQFDSLDADKSGKLDKVDLIRMVEQKKEKLQELAIASGKNKLVRTMHKEGLAPSSAPAGEPGDSTHDPVHLYDPEANEKVFELEGHGGGSASTSYGPDGPPGTRVEVTSSSGPRRWLPFGQSERSRRRRQIGAGLPHALTATMRRPRVPTHLRKTKVGPGS